MAKTIQITLSSESIEQARRELEQYEKKLTALTAKVNNALLDEAKEFFDERKSTSSFITPRQAAAITSAVDYGHTSEAESSGTFTAYGRNEHTDPINGKTYGDFNILYAVEFGAGARNATSPDAEQMGMGPGTYSPNGHWDDPEGWFYPSDELDANGNPIWKRTYGTPASYPVYQTARHIEENGTHIAKEVISEWL